MFIHFAFGPLGKQGKIEEQVEATIDCILKNKCLLVSKCTEFIPEFHESGEKRIPIDKMRSESNSSGARLVFDMKKIHELPDDDSIYYLQREVSMICFIRIAFNGLRTSSHWKEYGKMGIVLADRFLRSKDIRPVKYYTEESLLNDPLICKWNYELKSLQYDKRKDCENEILTYRKPATFFPAFKKSVIAKITASPSGGTLEFIKYNRYEGGYDFSKEHEYRIVFDEGIDYLYFEEKDLFMVITPDIKAQRKIQDFFSQNWKDKPQVMTYPS